MGQLALQPSLVKFKGELGSVASHDKGTVQRALVVYKIIYHRYGRLRLKIPRLITGYFLFPFAFENEFETPCQDTSL